MQCKLLVCAMNAIHAYTIRCNKWPAHCFSLADYYEVQLFLVASLIQDNQEFRAHSINLAVIDLDRRRLRLFQLPTICTLACHFEYDAFLILRHWYQTINQESGL